MVRARARVCVHTTNVYVRWLFKRETLGKLATVGGRLNNGRWSVRYSSGRITGLATAGYKFRFRGMFKHGRWAEGWGVEGIKMDEISLGLQLLRRSD